MITIINTNIIRYDIRIRYTWKVKRAYRYRNEKIVLGKADTILLLLLSGDNTILYCYIVPWIFIPSYSGLLRRDNKRNIIKRQNNNRNVTILQYFIIIAVIWTQSYGIREN